MPLSIIYSLLTSLSHPMESSEGVIGGVVIRDPFLGDTLGILFRNWRAYWLDIRRATTVGLLPSLRRHALLEKSTEQSASPSSAQLLASPVSTNNRSFKLASIPKIISKNLSLSSEISLEWFIQYRDMVQKQHIFYIQRLKEEVNSRIDFLTTIHKRQHSLIQELKTKLKELQQIQQQTATSLIKISNFQESLTERTGKLLHRINNFHPLSEAEKKYLKELKKFQLQVAEYNKKIEELKLQTEKFQNLKEPFPLISLNKEQQEEIIRALKKNKKKIWQNVSKLRELQKQMDMMQMYDS
jgi:hypothetical protein